ncbi:type II toxin-antitoxin system VapC family toxin [Microseira sp. BLCC-F43]|jgi:predicted nucleic acid-binding protein|uniref:type II toxin-antitoxin system VapC family toxin n=1 Tax=Microseira sp. BLCC-F43 TaxID=3153602 RepID=UPI0035BB87DE
MARYLLDTNVVLRFGNPADVQHHLATEAIYRLLTQGNECFLTAQVLIEFWVVATRPIEVNVLGWTVEQTRSIIDQLLNRFPLLEESSQIFPNWLDLVTTSKVMGKRTDDDRIIAVMLAQEITHLLTFNPRDFAIAPTITIVRPPELARLEADES